jgi:AcrR family transcriptional regulator
MLTTRGPQQARSHATHARLIEAAAECLVQKGYAGTSTQAVAQGAGVSQGALFKHFPSKAELLGAAVQHLLASLVRSFQGELARRLSGAAGGGSRERVGPAVGALWAVFRSAELSALLEVYVAARTDAVLEAQLGPALEAHNAQILDEARRLFPEAASHPEFEGAIAAVVYAMQGAAVGVFGPAARDDGANLAFFERLALRELGHLTSTERGRHG